MKDQQAQLQWLRLNADWDRCQRCPLGRSCTHHVLGRGHLPAEWLFFGLAPGYNEDRLGTPYAAAEGRAVRRVKRTLADLSASRADALRVFYGYALACRPVDDKGQTRSPSRSELETCWPRVTNTLDIVKPRGAVVFGRVASVHVADELERRGVPYATLATPLALLKAGRDDVVWGEVAEKLSTLLLEANRESETTTN